MSTVALVEFHHTIIAIIVVVALLTAVCKAIALKRRWRDGQEPRRIFAILVCLLAAYINGLRFAGRASYDPVALAQGSVYIIGLLLVVMWFAVSEW